MGIENLIESTANGTLLTSLLLMGIENPRRARPGPVAYASHYPSWGSKTGVIGYGLPHYAVNSLPLMGIENR